MPEASEAARAEIAAIFRKRLIRFAAHCTLLGAVVGVLTAFLIQFVRDTRDMSLATAWDLFIHLPPSDWVSFRQVGLMVLVSTVLTPLFTTTALYLAERPEWNK